ncbi:amino acid transporter [Brevibacillus nitrificans]|nr:amino acid transporter [Brevibacillus nitrificans]
MLFTAASYGSMVKEFPVAGSAYSYARQTINPHFGFLVGWVSLLDYVFLPIINVLLGTIYLSAAFPNVPSWILGLLLAALAIQHLTGTSPTGSAFPITPFYGEGMSFPTLMAGAAILCFSFLGFDAVTTYTEEAINPMKTIPRGIFLVALIGGFIFIIASYFTQLAFPSVVPFQNQDSPSPEMSMILGGDLFHSIFVVSSFLKKTLSSLFHNHDLD